ncbi:hypothetical protein D1BOALGB6SA_4172 [Olavius sp. associated proteobacterium Delta 1]|nr:hypothetical protein D1BOALGB6SA_4172 [Olavius sp. associated proteobacterium Delta 1]
MKVEHFILTGAHIFAVSPVVRLCPNLARQEHKVPAPLFVTAETGRSDSEYR